MRFPRRFLPLLVMVAATPLAAQSPTMAQRAAVAGCYRLKLGGWSMQMPSVLPEEYRAPPIFRLDTTPSPRVAGFFEVVPSSITSRPRFIPASWRLIGSDSVELFWSNGFSGLRFGLRTTGDTLLGKVTAFTDIRQMNEPMAQATAVRATCPEGFHP